MCTSVVYASGFTTKTGTIVWSMENASKLNPYFELEYRYDLPHIYFARLNESLGLSVGYYNVLIKGEEMIASYTWGNNQYRLRLHAMPIVLSYNVEGKRFYGGIGGGVQLLSCERMYDDVSGEYDGKYYGGKPRSHDTYLGQAKVGWNINDKWSLSVTYNFSDLDLESGSPYIGIAEDETNLNMVILSVGCRW